MSATGQPSEEELRAAYEAEIKKIRVEQILLEQLVTLINLGMRRTGLQPGTEDERDPVQVRVAIEGVRALLPLVEDGVGAEQTGAIRQALSQLQLAYVRIGGQDRPYRVLVGPRRPARASPAPARGGPVRARPAPEAPRPAPEAPRPAPEAPRPAPEAPRPAPEGRRPGRRDRPARSRTPSPKAPPDRPGRRSAAAVSGSPASADPRPAGGARAACVRPLPIHCGRLVTQVVLWRDDRALP